jgi:hypothetical protein
VTWSAVVTLFTVVVAESADYVGVIVFMDSFGR